MRRRAARFPSSGRHERLSRRYGVRVIDSNCTVRFIDVHAGYTSRSDVQDILAALDGVD